MIDVLVTAARSAGERLLALQNRPLARVSDKGVRGFATEADLAAQEIILQALRAAYPAIPIVAEEQAEHALPDGPFFTVDPLDGTAVYARGESDAYGVALCYLDQVPTIAVLYQPARDVLVIAERERGCTRNGEVVSWKDRDQAPEVPFGYEAPEERAAGVARTLALLDDGREPARLKTSVGDATAMIESRIRAIVNVHPGTAIWDLAPFALALEEAGGVAAALDGSPLAWNAIYITGILARDRATLNRIANAVR